MAAGDILYKVNGEDITEKSLTDVVKNIKGEEGTTVDLTLYRDGQEMTITATRRSIEIQTVSYKMMDNQIGYIKVTEFEETTLDQFKKAKEDLTAQGAAGLVIDLRDNPGGNVDTVCDMLDELLPQGLIVYTKDKDGNVKNYYSKGDDTLGMPLTVLVNENSASASEIFSGAVQDRGIGTIVGTTTYGKGVMLNAVGLQNPGVDTLIERDLPFLAKFDTKVIVNVCGHSADEYIEVAERLSDEEVDLLEINISCPNVRQGGIAFGQDPAAVEEITREIKRHAKQPVIMIDKDRGIS